MGFSSLTIALLYGYPDHFFHLTSEYNGHPLGFSFNLVSLKVHLGTLDYGSIIENLFLLGLDKLIVPCNCKTVI